MSGWALGVFVLVALTAVGVFAWRAPQGNDAITRGLALLGVEEPVFAAAGDLDNPAPVPAPASAIETGEIETGSIDAGTAQTEAAQTGTAPISDSATPVSAPLASAAAQRDMARLQTQRAALLADIGQLQGQRAELRTLSSESEALRGDLATLRSESKDLNAARAADESAAKAARAERDSLTGEVRDLKRQRSAMRNEAATSKATRRDLDARERKLTDAKAELDQTRAAVSRLTERRNALLNYIAVAEAHIAALDDMAATRGETLPPPPAAQIPVQASARTENQTGAAAPPAIKSAAVVSRTDSASGPAPESAPASIAPRIFVNMGRRVSAEEGERISGLLGAAGFEVEAVRNISQFVSESSVRYFFKNDRATAERMYKAVIMEMAGATNDGPVDFSYYRPLPRAGTFEIWVSGAKK